MPKISVLMSVYNETPEQLHLAIDSVLKQTYQDFELVIINDAPQNLAIKECLHEIENEHCEKVHIYFNENNIGLALSMNRAAELSSGEYIARMDSDDISCPDRFEKEVSVLDSGLYDFVFTNNETISESGELLKIKDVFPITQDEDICSHICQDNFIHHPTIMMTRSIFEKAGQYRNFPCAQDYDLWLRLVSVGCRFHMIDESLYIYRLRDTSVTARKRLQQKLTLDYSRELFLQRIKTGADSYSYEGYCNYIQQRTRRYKNVEQQLEKNRVKLQQAQEYKAARRILRYYLCRFSVFIGSPIYRGSYLKKRYLVRKIRKIQKES